MPFVLKAKFKDEVRCVTLPDDVGQNLTSDKVKQAISQFWPDLPTYKAKYRDREGDLCALTAETIPHFTRSAVVSGDETILKLELYAEGQIEPQPSKSDIQERVKPPSLICSWLDIFTMGFSADRQKVLDVQGPKDLITKIKAEAASMSLIIALVWKDSMGLYLQLSTGHWDKIFKGDGFGTSQLPLAWYCYAGLATFALCFLTIALMCNILLLITLNNVIEPHAAAFIEDAGWTMKVPYLGAVYGLLSYVGAQGLLAYFVTDTRWWLIFVLSLLGAGVLCVQYSCARYIHASYVANGVSARSAYNSSDASHAGYYKLLSVANVAVVSSD